MSITKTILGIVTAFFAAFALGAILFNYSEAMIGMGICMVGMVILVVLVANENKQPISTQLNPMQEELNELLAKQLDAHEKSINKMGDEISSIRMKAGFKNQ